MMTCRFIKMFLLGIMLVSAEASPSSSDTMCVSKLEQPAIEILNRTSSMIVSRAIPDWPWSLSAYNAMRDSMKSGIRICVLLEFSVDGDGTPYDITVRNSYPSDVFDRTSIEALKEFVFKCDSANCSGLLFQVIIEGTYDYETEDNGNGNDVMVEP